MTYLLKNFLHEFAAGQPIREFCDCSLFSQPQIHGGNFKSIGNVTRLIPYVTRILVVPTFAAGGLAALVTACSLRSDVQSLRS